MISLVQPLVHVAAVAMPHGALRDVLNEVARHGYLIIFVLIAVETFAFPLPGEVSLLVGAYEAHRGVFGLGWVIVVGAVAAISGDNLGYLFGRRRGRALVQRLLRRLRLHSASLERVDAYFGRHAGLTIFVARQISPLRGLAAVSAGTARVPWRRFALVNALACVVWSAVVTLIAAALVGHLDELADDISVAGLIALGAIVVAAAAIVWYRFRLRNSRARRSTATRAEQPTAARQQPEGNRTGGPERDPAGGGDEPPAAGDEPAGRPANEPRDGHL